MAVTHKIIDEFPFTGRVPEDGYGYSVTCSCGLIFVEGCNPDLDSSEEAKPIVLEEWEQHRQ